LGSLSIFVLADFGLLGVPGVPFKAKKQNVKNIQQRKQ